MNNSSVIFHIKEFFTLRCVEYAACFRQVNSSIQFAHELAKLCKCTKCPLASQNWHKLYVIQKQVVIVQFVPLFCASERGIQTIYLKPNKLPKNMPPWPKLAKMKTTSLATLKDNPQSVGQNSMLTKFTFSLGLFDHAFYFYPAFWINMHLRPPQAIH